LSSGAQQVVLGGVASGTEVDAHGFELAGRFLNFPAGGTVVNTLVHSGGILAMGVFGLASGATIEAGGHLFELAGVTSNVSLAGTQFVGGSLPGVPMSVPPPTAVASGTVVSSGGIQLVNSNGSAVGTNVMSGGEIVFNGGTVSGLSLSSGGVIDLATLAFNSSATLAFAENGAGTQGTLTVTRGGHSLAITLLGQYVAAGFSLSKDAAGATAISYTPPTSHIEIAAGHH
jgi:autotransporter passenger strand-loop-strand repeat protein